MSATLTALGDWRAGITVPLRNVLGVSMDVMGRTGEEACKHALIVMAQSAAAITPKAPARRPVEKNSQFRHVLTSNGYKKARAAGKYMGYYFKYTAMKLQRQPLPDVALFGNTRDSIGKISPSRRGLAKRSWMWGLGQLGATEGRPMAGTFRAFTLHAANGKQMGYGKENRLSYVASIMPAGWEATVANNAGRTIMKRAAMKIQADFVNAVQSGTKAGANRAATLAPYFKAVSA